MMSSADSRAYNSNRAEFVKRAIKLGSDAADSYDFYDFWMPYLMRDNNVYSLPTFNLEGERRLAPRDLLPLSLDLTKCDPLMAAYMLKKKARHSQFPHLEEDILLAVERLPSIAQGLNGAEERAHKILAGSLLLLPTLDEARERYKQIGTARFDASNPGMRQFLSEHGYLDPSQAGRGKLKPNLTLREKVRIQMGSFHQGVASLVAK
jgi:hypothetical protein